LILICFCAMASLLTLQGYWIVKYYRSTTVNFEKEANLAFEDGIKKELALRCDTIQAIMEKKMLDTSAFLISARFDQKDKTYVYTISSKGNENDKFSSSFSSPNLNKALPKNESDKSVRKQVAAILALSMRKEDMEQHTIYYRTQTLGRFLEEQTKKYQFDTTRLRPAFNRYLKDRSINVPYHFIVRKTDSTNNKGVIESASMRKHHIITRAFSTYRYSDDQNYVRAVFESPFGYVFSQIWLLLCSSFAMILLVAGCMIFILKTLFREKRLSAVKNDFISNITHEFKTPIATVSVALEALSNSEIRKDEEKNKRYLFHARNEVERLSFLVDKILNIAVYEDGESPLAKEEIIIDDTIKELINIYKITEGREACITYENDSNVVLLNVDKLQFQHAISNILDNSIKYSDEEVQVAVKVSAVEGALSIAIKDKGIGVDEKETSAIFEKFYRVSTGNRHPVKGFGLGLNYVKQIMSQHNGSYEIMSAPGKGTSITLIWPL
jgi:two-component system phosphate regulon sensor histidine kinase PhoR